MYSKNPKPQFDPDPDYEHPPVVYNPPQPMADLPLLDEERDAETVVLQPVRVDDEA